MISHPYKWLAKIIYYGVNVNVYNSLSLRWYEWLRMYQRLILYLLTKGSRSMCALFRDVYHVNLIC